MPVPMVLDEIITKLCVSDDFLDVSVGLKKYLEPIDVSCWFNKAPNIVIENLQVHVPLILDDHVMENHTCSHIWCYWWFSCPKTEPDLKQ
jgi:hypothetical protein